MYAWVWMKYLRADFDRWGFPGVSDSKASACNAGDLGSIPGMGRSPGGGRGNPLQYTWRAFLIAQLVKNPHAMQETLVQFLGQEYPLEME